MMKKSTVPNVQEYQEKERRVHSSRKSTRAGYGAAATLSPTSAEMTALSTVTERELRVPCYCEENVWRLAYRRLYGCQQGDDGDSKEYHVVFISNQVKCCPMFHQLAKDNPREPCLWDYHVILLCTTTTACTATAKSNVDDDDDDTRKPTHSNSEKSGPSGVDRVAAATETFEIGNNNSFVQESGTTDCEEGFANEQSAVSSESSSSDTQVIPSTGLMDPSLSSFTSFPPHSTSNECTTTTVVYDMDSRLPYPCPVQQYVTKTFGDVDYLRNIYGDKYSPMFRVVRAESYLQHFYSDRMHMYDEENEEWLATPPTYDCIMVGWDESCRMNTNGHRSNLDDYIDMEKGRTNVADDGMHNALDERNRKSQSIMGDVLTLEGFLAHFPS